MPVAEAVEFLTVADVGRLVGLSSDGVRVAAESGRLRVAAHTAGGKIRLFTREDVEAFKRDRSKRRR
jgi:hypothetical protein